MLLNFDDQQLRSSLALWKEAMEVGDLASDGRTPSEHAQVLARLDDTVKGSLAVLHACAAVGDEAIAMRELVEELQALREWIQEGRAALDIVGGQR